MSATEDLKRVEKERSEAVQMVHYLLRRMRSGNRGASSDALIQSCFSIDKPTAVPHDLDDLSRCFMAFAEAPPFLREKMLPTLTEWTCALDGGFQDMSALQPTDETRDYLTRTIATIRNHKDQDNCWPQWANKLADEIERMWALLEKGGAS